MTVGQISKGMTTREFIGWVIHFSADQQAEEIDLENPDPNQLRNLFG